MNSRRRKRTTRRPHRALLFVVAAISLAPLAGCGQTDQAYARTVARLRTIAAAYLDFVAARGAGPSGEAQLRAHLQHSMAFVAAKEVTGDVAQLFASARDGQPFQINYGLSMGGADGPASQAIAVESEGLCGERLAAFANGKVDCVACN
jgi:hypothetical protein